MLRHHDEDLLPFPLTDTIGSAEALRALGYEDLRPLIYLIDEGRFDAYQLVAWSPWRISRSSFGVFVKKARPETSNSAKLIRQSCLGK